MGLPVLVYGKSGSGKSRSLKFFAEDEILLVNVEGKQLPFRSKFKYQLKTDNTDTIMSQLAKMPCKVGVIDDAGYLMTHHFMNNHRNKKGNASFDMYDDIADTMYFLVQNIKNNLPEDVIVYIMLHEDTSDAGDTKIRTIGKLIDNKVCLEGMVTICIRCMSDNGKHFFRTQTDGFDISKTPEEMFEEVEIDNNLKFVDDTIRKFYGWTASKKKGKGDAKDG